LARARRGSAVKSKLGFLIYGDKGTWKSSLALEFAKFKREDGKPFRVLYIDAESGSVDDYLELYANEGIALENIYIIYTQSLGEVREYIRKVAENEDLYELDNEGNETDEIVLDADGQPFRADAIVVDGASVIYLATQQGLVEFSKKRATVRAERKELIGDERIVTIEGAGMELKDWQTLQFKGQDLILDLLASGKHWAVTAREADEKESVKDSDGKISSVVTGRKVPEGFKKMDYNAKTVLHTFIDENDGLVKAIVENKDRTLIHMQNEVLIEPSLLDWQAVIDKNVNKKDFTIANNLKKSVETESEIYEKEIEESANKAISNNTNEPESLDDYYDKIQNIITNLPEVKKKTVQTQIRKMGLPMNFKGLKDVDKLQKYLEIVEQ
jgi:hypothetical protein